MVTAHSYADFKEIILLLHSQVQQPSTKLWAKGCTWALHTQTQAWQRAGLVHGNVVLRKDVQHDVCQILRLSCARLQAKVSAVSR